MGTLGVGLITLAVFYSFPEAAMATTRGVIGVILGLLLVSIGNLLFFRERNYHAQDQKGPELAARFVLLLPGFNLFALFFILLTELGIVDMWGDTEVGPETTLASSSNAPTATQTPLNDQRIAGEVVETFQRSRQSANKAMAVARFAMVYSLLISLYYLLLPDPELERVLGIRVEMHAFLAVVLFLLSGYIAARIYRCPWCMDSIRLGSAPLQCPHCKSRLRLLNDAYSAQQIIEQWSQQTKKGRWIINTFNLLVALAIILAILEKNAFMNDFFNSSFSVLLALIWVAALFLSLFFAFLIGKCPRCKEAVWNPLNFRKPNPEECPNCGVRLKSSQDSVESR